MTSPTLEAIYHRLVTHFGRLHGPLAVRPWWPIFGDDPAFEMLVGAVLVQQTRWETVEKVVQRLLAADLLSPVALGHVEVADLVPLLRPAAFYPQKAIGLRALAAYILTGYHGSTTRLLARPLEDLRAELLALPRIGPETCDVTMLYGGGHPVFVVDAYTRRLFARVGPVPHQHEYECWRRDRYEQVRQTIEATLAASVPAEPPVALYAEFHAQINEVCVRYCLARPRCDGPPSRRVYSRQDGRESYLDHADGCPLRGICRYYREEQRDAPSRRSSGRNRGKPA
ncbi:Fe-S cluster assembly protein HesB [Candidatus Chloroploca sp. Khr17]|uniref:endonuclease III domain-containing protein n=1 Tax=Candidatus Chloroploca sp. Khr17 TaxID=2496869 RepID=UPI001F108D6B|nr:Fe-S cluster assembly protein HesB [Candidatus Chloroploca sp. Khr17]